MYLWYSALDYPQQDLECVFENFSTEMYIFPDGFGHCWSYGRYFLKQNIPVQAVRFCNSRIFYFWFAIFPSINIHRLQWLISQLKDFISRLRSNTMWYDASLAHLSMEKAKCTLVWKSYKNIFQCRFFRS